MAERSKLIAKCKGLGIKVTGKTRINVMKDKLKALGVNNEQPVSVNPQQSNNVNLSANQIAEIVNSVVSKLSNSTATTSGSKKKPSDSATSSSSDGSGEESDDESSVVVGEAESSGHSRRKRQKRNKYGKKDFNSRPSLALSYCVSESVKKLILDGKSFPYTNFYLVLVPVYQVMSHLLRKMMVWSSFEWANPAKIENWLDNL